MALLKNGGTYADLRLRFTGGTAAGQIALARPESLMVDGEVGHQSIPAGYGSGGLVPAIKTGWLGSYHHADGASSTTAAIRADGYVQGSSVGLGQVIDALAARGVVRTGSATGTGTLAASSYARGVLAARVDVGARPSADEIADAVWQRQTSGHVDPAVMGGLLRLLGQLARNRTVTDPVAGTITVYDDDDTTVLLTADLWDDADGTTPYSGAGADRRDRLT